MRQEELGILRAGRSCLSRACDFLDLQEDDMPKKSARILMYRFIGNSLEVFLVHPGGPFWAKKDLGAWSIPKGEYSEGEDPLHAARREFQEETGFVAEGQFIPLRPVTQPGGKIVLAWALEGDCDPRKIASNPFRMEWPPKSGKYREFPEVDRAEWFPLELAREKILKGQRSLLDELRLLVLLFLSLVYTARITGHWNSSLSEDEFRIRLLHIDSPAYRHPSVR